MLEHVVENEQSQSNRIREVRDMLAEHEVADRKRWEEEIRFRTEQRKSDKRARRAHWLMVLGIFATLGAVVLTWFLNKV